MENTTIQRINICQPKPAGPLSRANSEKEEQNMQRGRPAYSCGMERVRRIQACLNLAAQYQDGCRMDPVRAGIANAICRKLTQTELQCLRLYYNDGIQQGKIAAMLGRAQSTISRTLLRAEQKLEWALALPDLLNHT